MITTITAIHAPYIKYYYHAILVLTALAPLWNYWAIYVTSALLWWITCSAS